MPCSSRLDRPFTIHREASFNPNLPASLCPALSGSVSYVFLAFTASAFACNSVAFKSQLLVTVEEGVEGERVMDS